MADRTGTLWEHDGATASCNHGFASHGGVHILYRDMLGLRRLDTINRVIQLRFTDSRLDWCEGILPTADGLVELRWWKSGGKLLYKIAVPYGYVVTTENQTKLDLVQQP